jgi:hypothetical protein
VLLELIPLCASLVIIVAVIALDIEHAVAGSKAVVGPFVFAFALSLLVWTFGGLGWTLSDRANVGWLVFASRAFITTALFYAWAAGSLPAMIVLFVIGTLLAPTSAWMLARREYAAGAPRPN